MLGGLYDVCYESLMASFETTELDTFVPLLKAHCYFIYSLHAELARKVASGELAKPEAGRKAARVRHMNLEFVEKCWLYISQNTGRMNWRALSAIFEGLAISGFKAGRYKEAVRDLALTFLAELEELDAPAAVKKARLDKFLRNLDKLGLPASYRKWTNKNDFATAWPGRGEGCE